MKCLPHPNRCTIRGCNTTPVVTIAVEFPAGRRWLFAQCEDHRLRPWERGRFRRLVSASRVEVVPAPAARIGAVAVRHAV